MGQRAPSACRPSAKINRKDFGLTWNAALETGGILVGEEVTLTLDVEFVKAELSLECPENPR